MEWNGMQCNVMLCYVISCHVCGYVCGYVYMYMILYMYIILQDYIYIYTSYVYINIYVHMYVFILYIYYRDWLRTVHIWGCRHLWVRLCVRVWVSVCLSARPCERFAAAEHCTSVISVVLTLQCSRIKRALKKWKVPLIINNVQ